MTQQTFPAGSAQRIVLSNIDSDLTVHGWEQQTIKIAYDEATMLQQEGNALLIDGTSDDVELWVPVETIITVRNVGGDATFEGVLEIDVDDVDGDVTVNSISRTAHIDGVSGDANFHNIKGELVARNIDGDVSVQAANANVTLEEVGGDVKISGTASAVTVSNVGGDVEVKGVGGLVTLGDVGGDALVTGASALKVHGDIGGDGDFANLGSVELESIGGDLSLKGLGEARLSSVGGDLNASSGISLLHCSNVGGDCRIQGSGVEVLLENVGSDFTATGVQRVQIKNIGSDCQIRGNSEAEVIVGNVGSDLQIVAVGRVQVGNVGSDCEIRDAQGDVSIGDIGSDAKISNVGGNLHIASIGSDADLKDLRSSSTVGSVGSDLSLQAEFPAESMTRVQVASDARVIVPDAANLTIRATVGGSVSGRSVVSNSAGNHVNLVYGNGSAVLELNVGNDLHLRGNESPRNSSSSSFGYSGSWRDFEREMNNIGVEIEREMSKMSGDINRDVQHRMERHAKEQQRRAEELRRRGEKIRRHGDNQPRLHVRINDREWRLDPERLERIIEQARLAAQEGVFGALEAVEQAMRNLRVPERPVPPTPPIPPIPPVPPVSPVKPVTDTPANDGIGDSVEDIEVVQDIDNGEAVAQGEQERREPAEAPEANAEQEREAILRMIAEGRISPEEGDLLLEALG